MPLYEYQCPKCGRFELIRKFADEPLTICPTCGSEIQKLMSAPAIQFKGTGWYVTDYAKKSGGEGKSGKPEGSSSESKSDAKSDSKSDAKKSDGGSDKSKSSSDSTAAKPSKDGGSKS